MTTEADAIQREQVGFADHLRLAQIMCASGYRFTTTTPATHAINNARLGNETAQTLGDVFGWSRPFARELLPSDLFAALEEAGELEAGELNAGGERDAGTLFRSKVRFSSLDGALFMHSAYPTLATDAVFFGPDTHKFVDAIVRHLGERTTPVIRAADICTGAGPGALAIAKRVPDADVYMIDINPKALRYASVNAAVAGCARAEARFSDKLRDVPGAFDLVVAHPPYLVDRRSRAYRHGGGALGADLSMAIVREGLQRLAPGGTLLLFTGIAMVRGQDPFLAQLAPLIDRNGCTWTYREADPDVFGEELAYLAYAGVDRIALVVLDVSRPADALGT